MASGVSSNEPTARAFPKPTLEFTARSPGTAVEVKARRRDACRTDVLGMPFFTACANAPVSAVE
ncbi:hypothetical protein BOC42_04280 [Burkholderia pseudomallei]|nr:hypothetical protein BOC42_04280 [Burkholderia pseudomallei]ARL84965.1 hypothetical protein BOC57_00970 [Burkholderia pseudomallei]ARL96518.1 hypothetical protein BOC58_27225 [Burkholderia pseudomallei]